MEGGIIDGNFSAMGIWKMTLRSCRENKMIVYNILSFHIEGFIKNVITYHQSQRNKVLQYLVKNWEGSGPDFAIFKNWAKSIQLIKNWDGAGLVVNMS